MAFLLLRREPEPRIIKLLSSGFRIGVQGKLRWRESSGATHDVLLYWSKSFHYLAGAHPWSNCCSS